MAVGPCTISNGHAAVNPVEIAQSSLRAQVILLIGLGARDDAATGNVPAVDDDKSAG